MNVEKAFGWGYVLIFEGGEVALPDESTSVEMDKRKKKTLPEDVVDMLISALDVEGLEVDTILSAKRVYGVFARMDLGGRWSSWVWGDDAEEVMEQLDDLYGLYEDYL